MKKTYYLIVILLLAINNLQAQENDTIVENTFFMEGNIPQMYLEHVDRISLQFVSISKKQFLNFKTHQPDSNYIFNSPIYTSAPFTITTKKTEYKFRNTPYDDEYRYIGYVPEINSHIISECKWVCVNYLLDNETDEKMMLPCDFDSGVLGLKISASKKQMLMYLSYDAANYADYYSHRAEIIFMQIGDAKGFHKLTNPKICIITEWSIEDIVWIDEKSIALKVYDKYEDVWVEAWGHSIHEPVYQYFKAEIK